MIYVTGDTHCPIDIAKLNTKKFPAQRTMTKADYLIICGDVGIVWEPDSGEDRWWQKWFEEKNFTTLFVDGNHENHPALQAYPVELWNGGKIHRIKPSVIHLMRGQVYDIDGCIFFTMGGAASTDRIYREEGIDWWQEEIPSEGEREEALKNLEYADWKVDYVITHTAPDRMIQKIGAVNRLDAFTGFLSMLEEKLEYKHWYFGHFHDDRELDARHTLLYQKVVQIKVEEEI